MTAPVEAGGENLARLKSGLRRHPAAMRAVLGMGLSAASVERLHLGLKPPYRSRADGLETRDALCFPLLGEGLRAVGRYAYLNLVGLTANPPASGGWGPGPPLVYRLGSFDPDATAVVCADVVDCWLAWQLAGAGRPDLAFLSRSHRQAWPAEWRSPGFWLRFSRVVLVPGEGLPDLLLDVAPRIDRPVELLEIPPPFADLRQLAVAQDRPHVDAILSRTKPWTVAPPMAPGAAQPDAVGRFQAAPVRIAGAFVGGRAYYSFSVEERRLETLGVSGSRVVQSYSSMVLRSDGALLSAELLPAPRGTPADQRVLALDDGTRVLAEPAGAGEGTWSFGGIERFVRWRTGGGPVPFRALREILSDVEAFLRSRVWLPVDGHHLLSALYVVLSHVFQVFDAIPLLLVVGARATGKSELGEAIARLGFNSTVAGQLRAAGMIRLLDERRGLVVLDDADGDGRASITGTGELAQAIKTSYKKSTARKPVADRGGRVRVIDFFGPKVIGNTRGVDPVLGSRMLQVTTGAPPAGTVLADGQWSEERLTGLRDELHAWAMVAAADLHELWRGMSGPRIDRRAEITAPLRALIDFAGDADLAARLDALLAEPATFPAGT